LLLFYVVTIFGSTLLGLVETVWLGVGELCCVLSLHSVILTHVISFRGSSSLQEKFDKDFLLLSIENI